MSFECLKARGFCSVGFESNNMPVAFSRNCQAVSTCMHGWYPFLKATNLSGPCHAV